MFIGRRLSHGRWVLSSWVFLAGATSQAPGAPAPTPVVASQPITATANPFPQGDPERGKALYPSCTSCHSIDENEIGPRHRGVLGRKAGSVSDYAYSPALKASGVVWDKNTLDRWLTNPSAMVPGTKMYFLLADAQTRADIIAYLSQLK
jgi:cytochrome c